MSKIIFSYQKYNYFNPWSYQFNFPRKVECLASKWLILLLVGSHLFFATYSHAMCENYIVSGPPKDLAKCLKDYPDAIDKIDASDTPSLHWAIMSNSLEKVKILIKAGASINAVDAKTHETALKFTTSRKSPEAQQIVEALLKAHADPEIPDNWGTTPLSEAAACTNCGGIVKALIKHGANVNNPDEKGNTPLHTAAKAENLSAIKALLDAKANVAAVNSSGSTSLHEISNNSSKLVPEILELFAKSGANINALDSSGRTPLHKWMDTQVKTKTADPRVALEKFLSIGANPRIADKSGKTVVQIVQDGGDNRYVSELGRILNKNTTSISPAPDVLLPRRRTPPPPPPSRRTDDTPMAETGHILRRPPPPSPPWHRTDGTPMSEAGPTLPILRKTQPPSPPGSQSGVTAQMLEEAEEKTIDSITKSKERDRDQRYKAIEKLEEALGTPQSGKDRERLLKIVGDHLYDAEDDQRDLKEKISVLKKQLESTSTRNSSQIKSQLSRANESLAKSIVVQDKLKSLISKPKPQQKVSTPAVSSESPDYESRHEEIEHLIENVPSKGEVRKYKDYLRNLSTHLGHIEADQSETAHLISELKKEIEKTSPAQQRGLRVKLRGAELDLQMHEEMLEKLQAHISSLKSESSTKSSLKPMPSAVDTSIPLFVPPTSGDTASPGRIRILPTGPGSQTPSFLKATDHLKKTNSLSPSVHNSTHHNPTVPQSSELVAPLKQTNSTPDRNYRFGERSSPHRQEHFNKSKPLENLSSIKRGLQSIDDEDTTEKVKNEK